MGARMPPGRPEKASSEPRPNRSPRRLQEHARGPQKGPGAKRRQKGPSATRSSPDGPREKVPARSIVRYDILMCYPRAHRHSSALLHS